MAMGIAQRRAAKALRRKAIVRAKRQAEKASSGELADWGHWISAPSLPTRKASAALIEVAAPLTEGVDDRDMYYKCLMMAMVAWNLSLLPEEERKEQMVRFFEGMPGFGEEDQGCANNEALYSSFEEVMAELISRKMLLYPLDRRWLVDLDIIETADGYRVNVASAREAAA
jgi:hypothetical protein